MARTYKCAYKMCNNLGIAVDPIKYSNRYYCKTCLDEKLRIDKLRKEIMDTTLEIIPKEIPSLINKVINQWLELDYSLEYILYTVKYIKSNKCVLNYFYGVRYYMNKSEIKNTYDNLIRQKKLREQKDKVFEITNEEVDFKPVENNNRWSDLI